MPSAHDSARPASRRAPPTLSRRDFERMAAFIEAAVGIRMPPTKRTMLESRLARRVRELDLTFSSYCDRVLDGDAPEERVELLDRVTTNKTDFFREPRHFQFLEDQALPALRRGAAAGRPLRLWSAACASGEEPYTLAMGLAEAAARDPGLRFRILATDLSTRVLRQAATAEYTEEQARPIPLELRRRWLLRSVADRDVLRLRKAVRDHVELRQLNLLDRDWGLRQPQDVVFCRNVLIYFGRELQIQVVRRLADALTPGGFLFLGHSESLPARNLPLEPVAPTVYRRRPAHAEVRSR